VPVWVGRWDATSPQNVARLLDGTHAYWNTRMTASKNPGELVHVRAPSDRVTTTRWFHRVGGAEHRLGRSRLQQAPRRRGHIRLLQKKETSVDMQVDPHGHGFIAATSPAIRAGERSPRHGPESRSTTLSGRSRGPVPARGRSS
jgi:hypothetical protein